jgi:phosphatidylglycerophosphate synthase
VYARTLADGAMAPLFAFVVAAASDYVDGPLARHAGPASRHGVLLDSGADIAFVLLATTAGVAGDRLSWAVPVAIACAAVPYLGATLRRSAAVGAPVRAYSAVGHVAGVANYGLAGLLAASAAAPAAVWSPVLAAASAAVVALNVAACLLRWMRRSEP